MDQYEIKSGIPIPPVMRTGPTTKYPMAQLKVLESFFIPKAKAKRIATSLYATARRAGITVTVRQYTHEGVEGVMVWRTA